MIKAALALSAVGIIIMQPAAALTLVGIWALGTAMDNHGSN